MRNNDPRKDKTSEAYDQGYRDASNPQIRNGEIINPYNDPELRESYDAGFNKAYRDAYPECDK